MKGRQFGRFNFKLDFKRDLAVIVGRTWSSEIKEGDLVNWMNFYRRLIKESTAKDTSGYSEMVSGLKWAIGVFEGD